MSYEINSRHNDLARALFALVGKSNPLQLGADIHGVVVLEEERPERSYAAGERYWAGNINVGAGGAGVRSEILIRNPVASGILTTVLQLHSDVNYVIGYPDGTALPAGFGAALGTINVCDLRVRTDPALAPLTTTTLHIKNTLAATGIRALGGSAVTRDVGKRDFVAVLPPGGSLIFMPVLDNTAIFGSYFGREVAFAAAAQRG